MTVMDVFGLNKQTGSQVWDVLGQTEIEWDTRTYQLRLHAFITKISVQNRECVYLILNLFTDVYG